MSAGRRLRADAVVARHLAKPATGGVASVLGDRIERRTRLRLGLAGHQSPRHFLLIRKHLQTGELAYHYCHVPSVGRSR